MPTPSDLAAGRPATSADAALVRALGELLDLDLAAVVQDDPAEGPPAISACWPDDPDAVRRAIAARRHPDQPGATALTVSIDGQEGPIGALVIRAAPGRRLTPSGLRAAEAVARVIALERALRGERATAEAARLRMARLVDAGMALAAELSLDDLLTRLVETAREVLGARYAALGVLDPEGTGLSNFVTAGLDERETAAIGDLPHGRGLLGVLIRDARPLRLERIGDDPRSVGFPPHHPRMESFLGVPVALRGEVFGNLYITEKHGGPFGPDDEQVARTLAAQAAVAIDNARSVAAEREALLLAGEVQAAQARERAAAEGHRRAIQAQEAERARIARELHDEAGQVLTALALQLRVLEGHVADDDGRARLAELRASVNTATAGLRELASELRASGLREHGLASAIERQAARAGDAAGCAVDVAVGALPRTLPEEMEIALFRVVQEALTNVSRHSGAARASVLATAQGRRLRVMIEDDGRGFDPAAQLRGLGLAGMRERMELVGGALRIESTPGTGTAVIADVDLPESG